MTWGKKNKISLRWTWGLWSLSQKTLVKQLNKSIWEGQASLHRQRVGCGGCSVKLSPPCCSAAVLQLCSRGAGGSPVTPVSLYGITLLFLNQLASPQYCIKSVPQWKDKLSSLKIENLRKNKPTLFKNITKNKQTKKKDVWILVSPLTFTFSLRWFNFVFDSRVIKP